MPVTMAHRTESPEFSAPMSWLAATTTISAVAMASESRNVRLGGVRGGPSKGVMSPGHGSATMR